MLLACEVLTVIFELTSNPPLTTTNTNQHLKSLSNRPSVSRSHFWSLTGLEFVDFLTLSSTALEFFLPSCHNVLHLFAVT